MLSIRSQRLKDLYKKQLNGKELITNEAVQKEVNLIIEVKNMVKMRDYKRKL